MLPGCFHAFIWQLAESMASTLTIPLGISEIQHELKIFLEKPAKSLHYGKTAAPSALSSTTHKCFFSRIDMNDIKVKNTFTKFEGWQLIVYEKSWSRMCETHSWGMKNHINLWAHRHTNNIFSLPKHVRKSFQASRCHYMTVFYSFGFMGKVLHTWRWLIMAREVLSVGTEEDMTMDLMQCHHPLRSKQSQKYILP